jgi:hypothetical protein
MRVELQRHCGKVILSIDGRGVCIDESAARDVGFVSWLFAGFGDFPEQHAWQQMIDAKLRRIGGQGTTDGINTIR